MSDRTYKIFMTLIGVVCSYVVIKQFLAPDSLTLRNALIQGFFVAGYQDSQLISARSVGIPVPT
jgi:hypothetical protein